MSLSINRDKLVINISVIFSLCLLITPINTALDLSFNSLASQHSANNLNYTNTSLSIIDIIGPKVKEYISQALSAFEKNSTNTKELCDLKVSNSCISTNCYDSINTAYFGKDETNTSYFFLKKLIFDSSKNRDELSTYSSCLDHPYGFNKSLLQNISYLEVILDQTLQQEVQTTHYEELWSLFGVCAPVGCTNEEYAIFLNKTFHDLFEIDYIKFQNQLEVLSISHLESISSLFEWINILDLIPMLIIFIFIIILLFKIFPFCCFKSCFLKSRTPKTENNALNQAQEELQSNFSSQRRNSSLYNRAEFKKFQLSMTLKSHVSELFGKSKYPNMTGITYIVGFRGITIIFCVCGCLFFDLFNSPISIYQEDTFIDMMHGFFFTVYFVGIRYAPKVMLSCSGFCLYYKLICYLDEKSREESQRRTEKKKRKQQLQKSLTEGDDDDDEEDNTNASNDNNIVFEKKILTKDVKWKFLFRFWLNQIHKYIIFVLIVLLTRFSIMHLEELPYKVKGPIWFYYKERVVKADEASLFKSLLLVHELTFESEELDNVEFFVNYLWMVYAEIWFFLLCSFFIFVGYKYKFKFNYFFASVAISVIVCKIILIITDNPKKNNPEPEQQGDDIKLLSYMYPTLFYYLEGHCRCWNSYLNFIYFYIGMVFGSMNYIFQKKISYEMIVDLERHYLEKAHSFTKILNDRSKLSVYIISFISFIVVCLLSCLQFFIMRGITFEKLVLEHCEQFMGNSFLNGFFTFDAELVVCLINLTAFGFNLKGDNYIKNMFTHPFWFIFEKTYFLIILLSNLVILFILSQVELRITFNVYNVALFSLISLFFVMLISCLFYVIMELPMKKILKVILNAYMSNINELTQDDDNNKEEQNNLINYLPIINDYEDD